MRLAPPLTLAVLLALPAVAAPQEPAAVPASPEGAPEKDRAWNLWLGTGAGGFVEWVDSFAGTAPGAYDSSRRTDRLQLNARLDRELSRWFRSGLAYVYNSWTQDYYSGVTRIGSVDNTVQVVLADVTVRWLRFEHFELYSALGAGVGRWKEEGSGFASTHREVSSGFAFQLRYAGIAVGNERVRAFVDLGIGFEGLIVGGLTLRL
jgi:hypothetical protein